MAYERIAVVGAGSWGTALACAAARAGRSVTLVARTPEAADIIRNSREAPRLPGHRIPKEIAVAGEIGAVKDADAILLVVPAQSVRSMAASMQGLVRANAPVVVCAKGIERGTQKFMTEILAECLPGRIAAVLSGPSFATDVARGLPTAVTLAAHDEATAAGLSHAVGTATFRPYHTTDIRGVELGGAAKNVYAIAAGVVAGRKLGASALAALITRSFSELFRFGKACGAKPETLTGLSGLGDLVLTCSNTQSRNFSAGIALGEGRSPGDLRTSDKLAEGVETAPAFTEMARARGIELPIGAAVSAIVTGAMSVDQAIDGLLARPVRAEN
ncbi:MAG: NAD(P)-dependent glycerol-3-phosphate dehydrogenase [Pseudorhodoplanes sp.]|nr:NAD(P)-dependent glycerol-3-phosphate dehydrogenase [Pseudorhodoplanes sp.]